MTNSKSTILVASFVILGLLMSIQGIRAQAPVTLTVGFTGPNPNTLNPNNVFNSGSIIVREWFYDALVRYSKTLGVEPNLAQSWEFSPDGKQVTFHLVHNATWHDGVPLTADDVAFTFNLEAKYQPPQMTYYIGGLNSSQVVDPYTVTVTLNQPDASAVDLLAANVYILPKHIWANITNPGNATIDHPVGSGPFTFESWTPGQTVVGVANPNYHQGRPLVDRVVFREFSSPSSMVLALQNGEIDLAGPNITPETIPTLDANPNIKVVATPDVRYWYLNFDSYKNSTGNPTLRDKNVRIALLEDINTTALSNLVYNGYATPGSTIIPSAMTFWHNPNIQPYPFDPQAAATLLDSNGYKLGSDGTRASPSGVKMSYTLYVPSTEPLQLRAAQQIAQWWSQIGVKASPELIDDNSLLAKIAAYQHDMFIWDWILDPGTPGTWLSVFLSSQLFILNDSGYANSTYDQLYKQQQSALDQTQRQQIVFQMQQQIHDDAVYGVMYYNDAVEAYRTDHLTGFVDMSGGPLYDYNVFTFLEVHPISVATATMTSQSTSMTETSTPSVLSTTDLALIALVIVLVVAVAVLARRATKKKS